MYIEMFYLKNPYITIMRPYNYTSMFRPSSTQAYSVRHLQGDYPYYLSLSPSNLPLEVRSSISYRVLRHAGPVCRQAGCNEESMANE